MEPNEFIPTRRSLVSRLRQWGDQESWQEFFSTYWKLIYSVALKSGLTNEEAEDVVQETVLSVAKKMDTFKYDPAVCSFKGWLMHVTRLRIIDQLRKRQPATPLRAFQNGDDSMTSTLERIPDPAAALEDIWDAEWEKNLVDAAMKRVKRRVKAEHYQIFYLNVVKKFSVRKVAEMMGVHAAQVYLEKHRIANLIKKEVRLLESIKP
jgi:RNA polymerase sigma-70 factor (ECF subfamily)